ncbi:MAG: MBL fold metallo-hydrolase [Lachnospiraceae bacterium]|jgi:phosphoribosyl 1,2-cyclic phosphodiesterase|nr:MBL fold metallo-hydrolase [Lachnospiraceae bacterium]
MRFVSLASGSSGNCTVIGSDTTQLLVDAGISRKRTQDALQKMDLSLQDIDGIFITHEHSDHISGLFMIAKQTDMPIYATAATIAAIRNMPGAADMDPERFVPVKPDERLTVKDITVEPMHISHDAADPVGYRFACEHRKAAVCTDLGCYTDYTVECLKDCDVLLVEANHDVRMLQAGRYPYMLKQRILSPKGHLSNADSGKMVSRLLNDHVKAVFLGHLSEENNFPELAYETVRVEIIESDSPWHDAASDLPLYVARRRDASKVIEW